MARRICIVSHLYPATRDDYKGSFVHELAAELSARGHVVHVVTARRPGSVASEERDGVSIHRFRYCGWRQGKQLGELKGTPIVLLASLVGMGVLSCLRTVRQHRLEIIHAYWVAPGGLIGVLAAMITGSPVVATAAGSDLNRLPRHSMLRMVLQFTLARLRLLIAVSGDLGRKAAEVLPGIQRRVMVIFGPVGVVLQPVTVRFGPRRPPTLLYVGNLDPPKRVDVIIRALSAVVTACPDVTLRLVGDGSQRASLEQLVAELGLSQHVEFVGMLDRQQALEQYRDADIVVHSSDSEGSPVAIMEAMAASLPVVASAVGGVSELVNNGVTGFAITPDDSDTFAQRLVELLRSGRLRSQMGAAARRFAQEYLARPVVMARIEAVYDALVLGEPRKAEKTNNETTRVQT